MTSRRKCEEKHILSESTTELYWPLRLEVQPRSVLQSWCLLYLLGRCSDAGARKVQVTRGPQTGRGKATAIHQKQKSLTRARLLCLGGFADWFAKPPPPEEAPPKCYEVGGHVCKLWPSRRRGLKLHRRLLCRYPWGGRRAIAQPLFRRWALRIPSLDSGLPIPLATLGVPGCHGMGAALRQLSVPKSSRSPS